MKYRIKEESFIIEREDGNVVTCVGYIVQVLGLLWWHDIKIFVNDDNINEAKEKAEELLKNLNETY